MNPEVNFIKLIQSSGFITLPDGKVDWKCNYDHELRQFCHLLVNHLVLTCERAQDNNEKTCEYFLQEKDPISAAGCRGAALQAEKLANYMKTLFP